MRARGPAAVVQLVAFVGGGILGPVWHLTHHRNDHTHEAEEPSHRHAHEAEARAEKGAEELAAHPHLHARLHAHPHERPHVHSGARERVPGQPGAHAECAHAPAQIHEPNPPARPSDGRHAVTPLPAPLDHGHASIAHFGLALLGAPALLAVPAPQPGEWVLVARSTAALRLFHPSFPRPRPPPPSHPA